MRRFPLAYDFFDHQQLVAEHGFSALVTVESGGRRSSILYDGGMTPKGLGNNLLPPRPGHARSVRAALGRYGLAVLT